MHSAVRRLRFLFVVAFAAGSAEPSGLVVLSGTGASVAPFHDIADPLVFRRKFMEATNRPVVMPRP